LVQRRGIVISVQVPYLEDFTTKAILGGSYVFQSFIGGTGNVYTYKASATPNGIYVPAKGYPTNREISTNTSTVPLDILFTGRSVKAVGGCLFPSDSSGKYLPGSVTVDFTFVGGGKYTTTFSAPRGTTPPFASFTSDTPIASMDVKTTGGSAYPTIDHFYVGTAIPGPAVPEPATVIIWSLLGTLAIHARLVATTEGGLTAF